MSKEPDSIENVIQEVNENIHVRELIEHLQKNSKEISDCIVIYYNRIEKEWHVRPTPMDEYQEVGILETAKNMILNSDEGDSRTQGDGDD